MVTVTINGVSVQVPEGTTIMDAANAADIPIPSLCYLKGINEIGACRVCCVEVEGESRMVSACNNPVKDGMVVYTNSPRARQTRRVNVELLLSQHDCECATCVRSGNCRLQRIATDLGILNIPYEKDLTKGLWTTTFPLYRNPNKCIKCIRCIQVCEKVQGLGVWALAGSGGRATVDVSLNRVIKNADCALCGQCITHCPVGALRERDDTRQAFRALADKNKITVVQVAPAVRAAWGEDLGLERSEATMGRLTTALRRMGFDYVFDTGFSADLTIMEEANEFLARFRSGDCKRFPMFTSCCPGWVRFVKSQYPHLVPHLSTAKSPQQMFGAITKSWFAQLLGVDPSRLYCVSIMPCVAKKSECGLPTMKNDFGIRDVDLVLTTRELDRMIRAEHISASDLPEEACDSPLGTVTGAGVIFGATGGVMEAALRTAHYTLTGKNPAPDAFKTIRGSAVADGWVEREFDIAGTTIRCAVVNGLGNTRKLIEAILNGTVHYDFVEVMACPGGCVGGGGQPIPFDQHDEALTRGKRLYALDRANYLRFSHENPEVQALYDKFLGAPLSEEAELLLHTDHNGWYMPEAPKGLGNPDSNENY
ncbi:MAG: [FeFe] hydrogenase, group A [Butyricicoccaceae bacterium]